MPTLFLSMSNREAESEDDNSSAADEMPDTPTARREALYTPLVFGPTMATSIFPTQHLSDQTSYPSQELRTTMSSSSQETLSFERGMRGVPIINEDVDFMNLSDSQLVAYVRQAKDTYSFYFPEGCEELVQTERALILLAKNVTESIFNARFLPIKARYLLDENMDLYIRKVPGMCHSEVHGAVIGMCWGWSNANGLMRSIAVLDAWARNYGQKKLEPDVAIRARSDGNTRGPRCIIEIEVNHRSPREARELAAIYFRDPTVRIVLLLKVWNRRSDGTFAAACIVWVKGEGEGIECHTAHDFGTAPVNQQSRNSLSGINEDHRIIPFVPIDMVYTNPSPDRQSNSRLAQLVNIPASILVVNATNENGEHLNGLHPPIEDLQLNLSIFVDLIEEALPRDE